MKILKYILLMTSLGWGYYANAQFSPSSYGETINSSDLSVSFSIGEVFIQDQQETNFQVHSGLIQPWFDKEVSVLENWTQDLKIYPNPTSSTLTIDQDDSIFTNYQILTVNGRMVKKGSFNKTITDLNELQKGVYLLRLVNSEYIHYSLFEKF